MIRLTRLNKQMMYLNPDLIKTIEEAPDTTICLINGDTYLVLEKAAEVVGKIVDYRVLVGRLAENPAGLIQERGAVEELASSARG